MQCSKNHIFYPGDRITFTANEVYTISTNDSKPYGLVTRQILSDGRTGPLPYIVVSAETKDPEQDFLYFPYQHVVVKPHIHRMFQELPWYMDITTMSIRTASNNSLTHTIGSIYLYDHSKKSVVSNRNGNIKSHCPCIECVTWFRM